METTVQVENLLSTSGSNMDLLQRCIDYTVVNFKSNTLKCHDCHLTRNSAIADKPRDAFRGQSRSPNMVPFAMIYRISVL